MSVAPPIYSFACPACSRQGKSPRPIPPGTKVRCKCGHSFRTGDAGSLDVPTMEPELGPEIESPAPAADGFMDDLGIAVEGAPDDAPDETPEPIIKTQMKPPAVRTPTKGRAKEPFYFRVMEVLGWCDVVAGIGQFALMAILSLVAIGGGMSRVPEGENGSAFVKLAVLMVMPMGISLGILASCLLSGYFLWITVDIARSLRHANHLRITMGRE